MALGARPQDVLGTVLREGLMLTSIGLLLGLGAALLASRWLRGLLYGVSALDPFTYALAVAAIAAAALAGCWHPAAKATQGNPMDAIRAE
jgi:putative ABC transport system permease protein